MPYVVDRQHGLFLEDVVVILNVRERRVRSRVIMKDNGLYRTLTRTQTLVRRASEASVSGVAQGGATRRRNKGAQWRKQA